MEVLSVRKQEEAELQWLEQALLEDAPQAEEEEPDWVEEYYEQVCPDREAETPDSFTVTNTDRVDVDLDEYSEEVRRKPRRGSCLLTLALSLLCGVLVVYILLFVIFLWIL
jgi:hypothetical protein